MTSRSEFSGRGAGADFPSFGSNFKSAPAVFPESLPSSHPESELIEALCAEGILNEYRRSLPQPECMVMERKFYSDNVAESFSALNVVDHKVKLHHEKSNYGMSKNLYFILYSCNLIVFGRLHQK